MVDKNKTLSARIEEFKYDFLKDFAEETGVSLSEIQRTHLDQLALGVSEAEDGYDVDREEVDEAYQALLVQLNSGEVDTLDEFVDQNYDVEVPMPGFEVDIEFADALEEVVLYADAADYEKAEEVIEDWRAEGYGREALLMDLVLNQYRV